MTLHLKAVLSEARIPQGRLAAAVGISRPALNGLINHGHLPTGCDHAAVRSAITQYLVQHGAPAADWHLQEKGPTCANTSAPVSPPQDPDMARIPTSERAYLRSLMEDQGLGLDRITAAHRIELDAAGIPSCIGQSIDSLLDSLSLDLAAVRV